MNADFNSSDLYRGSFTLCIKDNIINANNRTSTRIPRAKYIAILTLLFLNNVPAGGDVIIQITNKGMEGISLPSDKVITNSIKNKAQTNHKSNNLIYFILNLPYRLNYAINSPCIGR